MTPLDKLLSWHGDWVLSDKFVMCRRCGARQAEPEREIVFPHIPECIRFNSSLNPWLALEEVQLAFRAAHPPHSEDL